MSTTATTVRTGLVLQPAGSTALDRCLPALLRCTQAAALAAHEWIGRGDRAAADQAAVAAMRAAFREVPGDGVIVIGEGEKDDAPMLAAGERVGTGNGVSFDVAVDPLENTRACSRDAEGALAVLAVAPGGTMLQTPAWYMDKIVVGPEAAGTIDISRPVEDNVQAVATALERPVTDVTVVVLDKPRHADLIDRLHRIGARVCLISDGDVAGALHALVPDGRADMLVGVGGAPEGVLTACAVRVLGGDMQGALAPQSDEEAARIREAGQLPGEPFGLDDLVASTHCCFVATGVTGGDWLEAPRRIDAGWRTSTLALAPPGRRMVVAEVHRQR